MLSFVSFCCGYDDPWLGQLHLHTLLGCRMRPHGSQVAATNGYDRSGFVQTLEPSSGLDDSGPINQGLTELEALYQVLIVDDDIELSASVAEQIEAAGGFTTGSVTTLEAAEHALLAPDADVSAVLLDVRMPDGDGRDLCARLRRNGIALPIILVSGLDGEDDVVHGFDSGADAYMRKPFEASELIARLRRVIPMFERA